MSAAPPARTTTAVLPLTIAMGAIAVVGAIANWVSSTGFPGEPPIETIYNFGITVDLGAFAVYALVRVLVLARTQRVPADGRLSPFGIVAAVIAVVTLVCWLASGGVEYWAGGMARYMTGAGPAFFFGIPWVFTLVFGDLATRRSDTPVNRAMAIGALAIGGGITVLTVAAAVIYGLGLSD